MSENNGSLKKRSGCMPQKETCKCYSLNRKDDIFASFFVFETKFENAMPVPWITATEDSTGNIVLTENGEIELETGDYAVLYSVSTVLETAGYMQITPFYNQTAHLPFGAYFKTSTDSASACGFNTLIIHILSKTRFRLNYNSNVKSRSGAATISFVKLKKEKTNENCASLCEEKKEQAMQQKQDKTE